MIQKVLCKGLGCGSSVEPSPSMYKVLGFSGLEEGFANQVKPKVCCALEMLTGSYHRASDKEPGKRNRVLMEEGDEFLVHVLDLLFVFSS